MSSSPFDFDPRNPSALLLEIMQPRDDYFGLEQIVGLFPKLLRAMEDIERPVAGADKFIEWLASGAVEELVESVAQKRRGISGLITEYPVHAALVKLAPQSNSANRIKMTALILCVAADWRSELSESDDPIYRARLQEACRALRKLSDKGMDWVPHYRNGVENFYRNFQLKLDGLDHRVFGERETRYLQELGRFFRFFVGEGRIIERASHHGARDDQAFTEGRWARRETDIDSEIDDSVMPRVYTTGISESAAEQHTLDGNAPSELAGELQLVDPGKKMNIPAGESLVHAIRKHGVKRAGLRRAGRILPGRWESLGQYELLCLLRGLHQNCYARPYETALLSLMLLTGRSPEAVFDCRVVANRAQLPERIDDVDKLFLIEDERAWACGILQPEGRRKKSHAWATFLQPVGGVFIAGVPDELWRLFDELTFTAASRARKRSVSLFGTNGRYISTSFNTCITDARDFIKELRASTGARITLKRIQSQLFSSMTVSSSDIVDAAMVTGSQPPFGQTAALYYQSSPAAALRQCYRDVIESWAALLETKPIARKAIAVLPDEVSLGTPFVVRKGDMRLTMDLIRQQLASYRKIRTSESARKFHNLYTAYTQWMLTWATGYRAVHDPLARSYEVNRRRGLVFIADKTGDDKGHHRAVPAPDVLIKQLKAYTDHCDVIQSRTVLVNVDSNPDAQFFYLDEKLQRQPATPRHLTREIEWAFPLPLNVSRHTLRSFLRENAVPGRLVDAFMGHWGVGTEPWSRYSSLDPFYLQRELTPLLSKLLVDLGFERIGGING